MTLTATAFFHGMTEARAINDLLVALDVYMNQPATRIATLTNPELMALHAKWVATNPDSRRAQ